VSRFGAAGLLSLETLSVAQDELSDIGSDLIYAKITAESQDGGLK
jgi:hypothetical protein